MGSTDTHLQERLSHAEKLWKQSVKDRQQMASAYGPQTNFPDGYIYPYNVWDFARPSFFCPHDLERLGTLGDGGKVVCGISQYEKESPGPSSESNPSPTLIVYSFGVSTDSSFEAVMLQRTNCEIWGYDYTVSSLTSLIGFLEQQLLIELHFDAGGSNQGGPRDLKTWMAWWSTLEEHGLRPVNNEDNWIGDVGSGKPRFMEYTLINVMQRERNKLLWG